MRSARGIIVHVEEMSDRLIERGPWARICVEIDMYR